jgi:hypothetical protein
MDQRGQAEVCPGADERQRGDAGPGQSPNDADAGQRRGPKDQDVACHNRKDHSDSGARLQVP